MVQRVLMREVNAGKQRCAECDGGVGGEGVEEEEKARLYRVE